MIQIEEYFSESKDKLKNNENKSESFESQEFVLKIMDSIYQKGGNYLYNKYIDEKIPEYANMIFMNVIENTVNSFFLNAG